MQDFTGSPVDNAIAMQKYGVGQPVRRKEDDTLVRGKGKYTDDINLPGQLYAWIVRSPHAHGVIRGIDTEAAKAMPGVRGVWTGRDLEAANYGPFTCGLPLKSQDGTPLFQTNRHALMTDKVRYVGDPVAFVVAETVAQARDAAEAVVLDIDALPAVTDCEAATKPGAPVLYDHIPNNVALDYHYGDTAAVEAAFASAAHVTKLDIENTRVAVVSMEPRCALATYEKSGGRYVIQVPTQGVAGNRNTLAKQLNVAPDKVRILTGNVGGSFGMKNISYPEYICLLHAAKELGKPVKWLDERSSSFLSDSHGRAQDIHAELALDKDGKFLAVRLKGYGNLGAYITGVSPSPLSLNTGKNLASVYKTPLLSVDIKCVLTNTTLMGAYRGAGRPEANYFMERLIDRAADEMGIDRFTLRKRNFIKPSQLPFAAASGVTYDSGDFQGVFDKALAISDHAGFAKRKKDSRKNGKLRGIAVGSYLEVTAPPSGELGKLTFGEDGTVTLTTGTLDYGQGHATPFRAGAVGTARRAVRGHPARAERQRPRAHGQRHRRLALDHRIGPGHRRSLGSRHCQGQGCRRASDGSLRSRHRIQGRPFHHCRHRPLHRHHGTVAACARGQDAGRRALLARCRPHLIGRALDIPERLSCRRSRDRSRHRRADHRQLRGGQRLRHHRQSDDRRRPVAWRRGPGHRPGADGESQL
jgi:carbon-monoxide dehydrogenase large subunit